MKYHILFCFIYFSLSLSQGINAQDNTLTERLDIKTDKDIYLPGEQVWFKIWDFDKDGKPSSLSLNGYVELLNSTDYPVIRQEVRFSGSTANNAFILPDTLSSGKYLIRTYTQWMRNFGPESFGYRSVLIINPFKMIDKLTRTNQPGTIHTEPESHTDTLKSNIEKSAVLKIITNDSVFGTRQKIKIELQANDNSGEYSNSDLSVSVTMKVPGLTGKNIQIASRHLINKQIITPEKYGTRISGKVFTREPKVPAGNIPLCLAFPGKAFQCWFTISGNDGRFEFILNNYTGDRDIILTSASNQIQDLIFELDDPFSDQFADMAREPFQFDESLMEYIEKSSINMQILNAVKSITESTDSAGVSFYGKPDKIIELDKYIKIPSMSEMISDLIPMVSTRKRDNKTQVVILGMKENEKYADILGYNPLLLIDGVPVLNSETFLKTVVPDIERIELIYSTYFFGSIAFDGLINLITRKGNCDIDLNGSATRLKLRFPESDKFFTSPDYSDSNELNSRTPDFRNTLYWNPRVLLDKDGKAGLEFYSSDNTGKFIINIKGYTPNGMKIEESYEFRVKKEKLR